MKPVVVRAHGGLEVLQYIDRVLPLSEVQLAHELIESRKVFGKIVLKP